MVYALAAGVTLTSHSAVEKRFFARAKKSNQKKHAPGGAPLRGSQSGREF
jgi:hypothetical protein